MRASQVAQWVKNPPTMWETQAQSLGWEDPLEEGMATHSSFLAWRIPWTEEPSGLESIGPHRVQHGWRDLALVSSSPVFFLCWIPLKSQVQDYLGPCPKRIYRLMGETVKIWALDHNRREPLMCCGHKLEAPHSFEQQWNGVADSKTWVRNKIVVFQSLSHVWLFATQWTAARQASPSFAISQSLLKLMSIESMMLSYPIFYAIASHPLSSPSPPAFCLYQHQDVF